MERVGRYLFFTNWSGGRGGGGWGEGWGVGGGVMMTINGSP